MNWNPNPTKPKVIYSHCVPPRAVECVCVEMFITENIHQNSEVVQRSHNPIDMGRELVIFLAPGGQHHSIASH